MDTDIKGILKKHGFVSASPLDKGWSKDKKLILTDAEGVRYLLRISEASLYEKKKKQFELLKSIGRLGLNCSRPVDFGLMEDGSVYTVMTYLEGEDGKTAVSRISDEEAYRLGLEAGELLSRIHSVALPEVEKTWWERYLEKLPRKVRALETCEFRLPMQEKILKYYTGHYEVMRNRPVVLCHGDYHLGNMVVDNGRIGIIDFDKCGPADPYDELKPAFWSAAVSEYFETGLINGYFCGRIPNDFWTILKFYTTESLISHLPWAVSFGSEEVRTALDEADRQLQWYGDFELEIPTWYRGSGI